MASVDGGVLKKIMYISAETYPSLCYLSKVCQ